MLRLGYPYEDTAHSVFKVHFFEIAVEHLFLLCYNLSVAVPLTSWLRVATSDEPIVTK